MLNVYDNKKGKHDSVAVFHEGFVKIVGYGSTLEEAYENWKIRFDKYIKWAIRELEETDLEEYYIVDAYGECIGHHSEE